MIDPDPDAYLVFDDSVLDKSYSHKIDLIRLQYSGNAHGLIKGIDLMLHLHRAGKIFYCPLKSNRKVDDSSGAEPYNAASDLQWSEQEAEQGKLIKIHGFPGALKVKLFRVAATTTRTEWIVTNDIDQASADETREICAIRWKIEQYHREVKQTLGIEKCQRRSATAQRNHITCVILAWNHLTEFARATMSNIYSIRTYAKETF